IDLGTFRDLLAPGITEDEAVDGNCDAARFSARRRRLHRDSAASQFSWPVMSRAPRSKEKYATTQSRKTKNRLRIPIRNQMWTSDQIAQAGKPERLKRPKSATADLRPIVARFP